VPLKIEDAFGVFELVEIGSDRYGQRVLDFVVQYPTKREAVEFASGLAAQTKFGRYIVLPLTCVEG
jgi:hypothetical protein